MPYKFETDHVHLPRSQDRRIKLTEEQKEEIIFLKGEYSQRALAKMYGVSRRLIQFIHDPEKKRQNLLRRAERGGSAIYYDKNKQAKIMREHRKYKAKVLGTKYMAN